MNAIEEELGIGEESEIIEYPENVEIIPKRTTGHFFVEGNYHDNLDQILDYRKLVRRNKD